KLYKLIQEAKRIIVMDNDLTNLNIKWIKALHKNIPLSIIHNTYQPQKGKTFCLASNKEIVLTELWNWAKQMSLLFFENRTSASLICHLRKDMQGIIHALKTDFPELQIKEYHGKSDPVEKATDFKKGLFQKLLNAKHKCLPCELQNRGIFPDIDSIIWNKDMPTIQLWVNSVTVKAKEISAITNATIVNCKTAEFLKNKLKKALEEIRSLD
ncbi:15688_t:CDS:2, partial [Funneliformis geosporum]